MIIFYRPLEVLRLGDEVAQVVVRIGFGAAHRVGGHVNLALLGLPDGCSAGDSAIDAVEGKVVAGIGQEAAANYGAQGSLLEPQRERRYLLQGPLLGLPVGKGRHFGYLLDQQEP